MRPVPRETRECPICKDSFVCEHWEDKKYCSANCHKKSGSFPWNKGTRKPKIKKGRNQLREKNNNWKGKGYINKQFHPDYKDALSNKPDKCEVCNIPAIDLSKGLCFDHDHKTNQFRGWLCTRCNSALGFAKDNVIILRSLADYIEKFDNKS